MVSRVTQCLSDDFEVFRKRDLSRVSKARVVVLGADDFEVIVDLDRQRDVFDRGVHDERGDRNLQIFRRPDHARQGREEHERLANIDGLVCRSVGVVAPGDDHYPDRADILRNLELVLVAAPCRELEGPEKRHDGREAPALGLLTDIRGAAAS